tara:strand:- start:64 stop:930 length:867 start_codon:yes stop_codon:yes gene_type:complete
MAISRVVYTDSGVQVTHSTVNSGSAIDILTAQNATFTVNVPRENVNGIGFSGPLDRPQLDAAEGTIEWTMVPQTSASASATDWTGANVDAHIDNTKGSAPTGGNVKAEGIGEIENAIMGSLSCESTVGALASMTCSFTGIPLTAIPSAAGTTQASAFALTLVESQHITESQLTGSGAGEFSQACAQSLSVAWDMPVVNVVCLGLDPTVSANVTPFSNPPGTASITVEGLSSSLAYNTGASNYTATIGDFAFTLDAGRIDSQTNSVAVGEVFSTFNYVIGGTADGFNCA